MKNRIEKRQMDALDREIYRRMAEQVEADIAYDESHRPSWRADVKLPYYFCTKIGVKNGYSRMDVESLLDKHYDRYGIPKLGDFLWGWPDGDCSLGDKRHQSLILADCSLVQLSWAQEVLDYVITAEPGSPTDDLLEYLRCAKAR